MAIALKINSATSPKRQPNTEDIDVSENIPNNKKITITKRGVNYKRKSKKLKFQTIDLVWYRRQSGRVENNGRRGAPTKRLTKNVGTLKTKMWQTIVSFNTTKKYTREYWEERYENENKALQTRDMKFKRGVLTFLVKNAELFDRMKEDNWRSKSIVHRKKLSIKCDAEYRKNNVDPTVSDRIQTTWTAWTYRGPWSN